MKDSSASRNIPEPRQLPGIEGFYVLTAAGELGRYRSDGSFAVDSALTSGLKGQIDLLLDQYRSGEADGMAVGLVMPRSPEVSWRSATLVFSDGALGVFYRTGTDPDAPLTAFQKRNKVKSIFQGMEVILAAREPSQPEHPRCCPVLFAPEVDARVLQARYGVSDAEPGRVFELIDLMHPLAPEDRRHALLSRMVMDMTRTRIAPEMRSGPELTLAAGTGAPPAPSQSAPGSVPWSDMPPERETCFNDGDPVTYWLLDWFSPFNELNDLQRQFIARGYTVTKRPAGSLLIERGSLEDISLYLIEGTLELEAFDGKKIDVVGGTKQAHLPISQLRPHAYNVRAATDVTVIIVSQKMLREVTRITTTYRDRPGIEVSEYSALPDDIPGLSTPGYTGGKP